MGDALRFSEALTLTGWRGEIATKIVTRGGDYLLAVKDNGPGIAPEFHDRVWGIFQTLEARDDIEGTGIGLAICRGIVETPSSVL